MSALSTMELDPRRLSPHADRALCIGRVVYVGRLALVPDVVVLEAVANGHSVPSGPALAGPHGRVVHVFRVPAGVVA